MSRAGGGASGLRAPEPRSGGDTVARLHLLRRICASDEEVICVLGGSVYLH